MKRLFRHVPLALAVVFTTVVSVFAFQAQQVNPPIPEFSGKVVSVADGDTITVLHDNNQHRIRLEGIDSPESHQAFGTKAKEAIANKVFGKEVTIKWKSRDKYQRILGEVFLGDRNINLEMVKEGFAWHYTQYSKDQNLAKAEKDAKANKSGLWADPNPVAPWDFRHGTGQPKEALVLGGGGKSFPVKGEQVDGKDVDPNIALAKTTVFTTRTGAKYHRAGCRYLAKSAFSKTLGEAFFTHGPCSVCRPPQLVPNEETVVLPIQKEKWDCEFLEKAYALKLTGVSYHREKILDRTTNRWFKLTFEYTADDVDNKIAGLKGVLPGVFYFLDEGNVVVGQHQIFKSEGQLTGKKGDGFRVLVGGEIAKVSATNKVQVREK